MSFIHELSSLPSFAALDPADQNKILKAAGLTKAEAVKSKEIALAYIDEIDDSRFWSFVILLAHHIRKDKEPNSDIVNLDILYDEFEGFEEVFGVLDTTTLVSIFRVLSDKLAVPRRKRSKQPTPKKVISVEDIDDLPI